jgi:hypothetical protein
MVVSHKNRNSRIWERPDPEDIIIEGNAKKGFNLLFIYNRWLLRTS